MTPPALQTGLPFPSSAASPPASPARHADPLRTRLLQIAGPGLLVSVGYMDPGNWATDIEAGSRYGYALLSVVLASSVAAMLLQVLSLRLGLASGRDLAQACREAYPAPVAGLLWILGELAIAACDLAELLGSALALHLLLHVSIMTGLVATALDTFVVLWLGGRGHRRIEAIVLGLVATIVACYVVEMVLAQPDWGAVARGFVPDTALAADPRQVFVAIGIVGATVMPHNLYLHSAMVLPRREGQGAQGLRRVVRLSTIETLASLTMALGVNAAILVLAASAFHASGHAEVTDIAEAWRMLDPLLGGTLASMLFAVALLAAGQAATFTGTLAGQVLLDGFLGLRIPAWQRRLATRLIAFVPAFIGLQCWGPDSIGRLLVASQVVLSLQLPFAMWPLLRLTRRPDLMGEFRTTRAWSVAAWAVFCVVGGANLWLVLSAVRGAGLLPQD